MIASGKPAAELDLHAVDAKSCSGSQTCFVVGSPSRAMVGTNAGTFYAQLGGASGGGGAACFVFLYYDAAGWHYVNVRCAQATGDIPGPQDLVKVSAAPMCATRQGSARMSWPVYPTGRLSMSTVRPSILMGTSGGT